MQFNLREGDIYYMLNIVNIYIKCVVDLGTIYYVFESLVCTQYKSLIWLLYDVLKSAKSIDSKDKDCIANKPGIWKN